MSHQGSPLSNKRDFSVGSLCAQSPPMDTVIVPPPLPSWGSPSASLSAQGEAATPASPMGKPQTREPTNPLAQMNLPVTELVRPVADPGHWPRTHAQK